MHLLVVLREGHVQAGVAAVVEQRGQQVDARADDGRVGVARLLQRGRPAAQAAPEGQRQQGLHLQRSGGGSRAS
jgi:hypothetical protein